MAMAESTNKSLFDPKSPPPALKSHRALSQRAAQLSQREPEHEAFGLEPPPRPAELMRMMCPTVVRTLKEYMSDAATVQAACERWASMTAQDVSSRHEAAECGAIEAVVGAMEMHTASAGVTENAMGALGNLAAGTDAQGLGRKQRAADAGVFEAIVAGMRMHADVSGVQANGAATLGNVASNVDDLGIARKRRAVEAGALDVLVGCLRAHIGDEAVCDMAAFALGNLVRGRGDKTSADDVDADADGSRARKQRAVELGALEAIVKAMGRHPSSWRVQEYGARAIANITFRSDDFRSKAIEAGATQETLDGACTARILVPDKEREVKGAPSAAADIN